MEESFVVLSVLPPEENNELRQFAALKIKKGTLPKYLFFTFSMESLAEYRLKISNFLESSYIFFYGEDNEITVLEKAINGRLSGRLINIREIALIMYPLEWASELEELAGKLKLKLQKKYRYPARRKTRLAWEVLKTCWEKGLDSPLDYVSRVEDWTKGLTVQYFFQELKRRQIKEYPQRPVRTGYVSNRRAGNLFSLDLSEKEQAFTLTANWVEECFQAGGLLSRSFPNYEHRNIQARMAREIINGFTSSSDVVIEAGTGTGKTIAYLIPALWWAKRNKTRVIVATHTITLQEQLFFKDLPFLQKVLPFNFKTALLKGRNNYICLHCFRQDILTAEHFSVQERLGRAVILSWLEETETGDWAELPNYTGLREIAKQYGADNPLCRPGECPYTEQCFLLEARKKAEEADLVVINHSLLLADIKTNNKVLPEYGDLIIDEAHNIHQTALKQLGFELSFEAVARLIDNLQANGKGSIINTLKTYHNLYSQTGSTSKAENIAAALAELPLCCLKAMEQTKELFRFLRSLLQDRRNLLLSSNKLDDNTFSAYKLIMENLLNRYHDLNSVLERVNKALYHDNEQPDSLKYDIMRHKNELDYLTEGLAEVLNKEDDGRVTYLEKTNTLYLKSTPLDVAGILEREIYAKNNSTVFTSATLSVAGSFSYFAGDIGLNNYHSLKLDSPFDYQEQMLFCVVNDLTVNQWPEDILAQRTASFIGDIAKLMGGRTMILFTSHRFLGLVYNCLQPELAGEGIKGLAQGINGSREAHLQEFMRKDRRILLGTSSFWEGIDIPGDRLRCVIMVKLPFWPPDGPLIEAKSKILLDQGVDPFSELLLPEAVIRFKQGFGRLIRTRGDKGVVILLDNRIIEKNYGKYFLRSLPVSTCYYGSSEEVKEKIFSWLK